MAKTGLRKVIAVASASGMSWTAANISVTPPQPVSVLSPCRRQAGRVNRGRSTAAALQKARKANINRPWLICSGCRPSGPAPAILASSVVPAMKAVAASMKPAALIFCGASMPQR